MISGPLQVPSGEVQAIGLSVYEPNDWSGNLQDLLTIIQCLVPTPYVDALAAQVEAHNSGFYTGQATQLLAQLAGQVDPSYPVFLATSGSSSGGAVNPALGSLLGNASSNGDNSRTNAIIGVCTSIGGLLLLSLAWWVYKNKRNANAGHQRLSMASDQTPPMHDPFADRNAVGYGATQEMRGDRRRESFFFAEDSLRGYAADNAVRQEEDEMYHHRPSPDMQQRSRGPIVPSNISAPILRESSLNW